ncbi:unnamed protein product, partial [Mesorhabditis spiculigera]
MANTCETFTTTFESTTPSSDPSPDDHQLSVIESPKVYSKAVKPKDLIEKVILSASIEDNIALGKQKQEGEQHEARLESILKTLDELKEDDWRHNTKRCF